MKKLLKMLEKNDTAYSIGRVIAIVSFLLFIVVSLYLAYFVKTWGNYDSFCMVVVALVCVQLGNKFIETKYFKVTKGDDVK